MPPRKSTDPPRKSNPAPPIASSSSAARFAPINDSPPPPPAVAAPSPFTMQAPTPFSNPGGMVGPPPVLGAPSALALPTMDPSSMPPPSLPPPAHHVHHQQTPDAGNVNFTPRPGSAVQSARGGSAFSQSSDKGKEKEEGGGKTGPGGHPKEAITIPIEELQLPKSIITRLAKGVLPPNTQIQANAILAMTKSATVFINHLANAANEVTLLQNKKTIMPADVFRALDDVEYGFMRERVEAEFAKFNETQTTKRSAYRKKVAVTKKGSKGSGESGGDGSVADTDGDTTMGGAGDTTTGSAAGSTGGSGGGQHRAKKARTEGSAEGMDAEEEEQDASDPESVPNEEDDDEEEAQEEEEEEEEEEGGENEGEHDELEEREDRVDDDEALDDGNNSD